MLAKCSTSAQIIREASADAGVGSRRGRRETRWRGDIFRFSCWGPTHKYSAKVMLYRRAGAFGIDKMARGEIDHGIHAASVTAPDIAEHAREGCC